MPISDCANDPEAGMTVTQADVAARAGVARKTVSNVINDYPHVSEDVRARVLRAIEELGYRPNHAARSLRSGRSRIIGLAVPELDVSYFAELARLVVEVAQERGLTVMIMQTLGHPDRELAVLNGTTTQFVEGLIYSPVALSGAELEGRRDRTPIVLLGERSSQGLVDHVGIDNVAAARAATEHLLALGRRRIAFIGSQRKASSEIARLRTTGYRQALEAGGCKVEPRLILPTAGYHRKDGMIAMRKLLGRSTARPDAVFCATDLLAQGAIRVLLEHGLRVPEDVAVVGFDDIDEGSYSTPTLTTIAPDKRQIAETAVARLLARAQSRTELPVNDTVTRFSLVVRESSAGRPSCD
ncbi:LacI family DNA-binding transcriptional regulator [Actinomadura opuntiae]|uniref:LacI family DNA-binding transcriptional regulator n=1 Tax=Actinomadura sp. OS1-43 TaxID=604315 RepID=UPI00255AC3A3|nr:LacI family DNA-binding transcriptional regulator [Actinomadura sp. OS1-43]MDL4821813.1 LacI family DNA-binding transcriptional regulator [Actinomadura sp. OS1-43]